MITLTPVGDYGEAPILVGGLKSVVERVAYMASVTANARYPRSPLPELVSVEAALLLILSKISTRDS